MRTADDRDDGISQIWGFEIIRWASRSSWRCQLVRLSFLALIVLEYPVSNDWPLQLMYEKLSIAWVGPGRPGRPAWLEAQLSA